MKLNKLILILGLLALNCCVHQQEVEKKYLPILNIEIYHEKDEPESVKSIIAITDSTASLTITIEGDTTYFSRKLLVEDKDSIIQLLHPIFPDSLPAEYWTRISEKQCNEMDGNLVDYVLNLFPIKVIKTMNSIYPAEIVTNYGYRNNISYGIDNDDMRLSYEELLSYEVKKIDIAGDSVAYYDGNYRIDYKLNYNEKEALKRIIAKIDNQSKYVFRSTKFFDINKKIVILNGKIIIDAEYYSFYSLPHYYELVNFMNVLKVQCVNEGKCVKIKDDEMIQITIVM